MATDTPSHRRTITAGLVGNVLEWYDFAVYGYLAPVLGDLFFPSDDPTASLLAAFGAFAAGFLMRPVGGILLGHIGDRFGRRRALTISVAMMAIPTFLMGLLPTALDIGVAAAVLVVIMRLVQGLAVGGEYVGSFAFLAERAPAGRKNFFASWSLVGGIFGTLLGSAVAAIFAGITDDDQMLDWGWRVPFLLSIVVALAAFLVRRGINEEAMPAKPASLPMVEAAKTNWRQLLQVTGLTVMTAVIFYTAFIYVATWLAAGDRYVPRPRARHQHGRPADYCRCCCPRRDGLPITWDAGGSLMGASAGFRGVLLSADLADAPRQLRACAGRPSRHRHPDFDLCRRLYRFRWQICFRATSA